MANRWQLPSGITDLSPEQSNQLYDLSHQLISLYQAAGFVFVHPPIAQYAVSDTQNNRAFLTTDAVDGEQLMVHCDISPQVGRIDRKYCQNNTIGRYCYVAQILQTQADDFYQSRNPIQAGVEIYGDSSHQADTLGIELMRKSLLILGFNEQDLLLNIGHIGLFEVLFKASLLDESLKSILQNIIRTRSMSDLSDFFNKYPIDNADDFMTLLSLNGDQSVLLKAKECYAKYDMIISMIVDLEKLLQSLIDGLIVHIDFATLDDKPYHSGLLFAYYHHNFSKALVKGGRYDGLNGRAATGFSLDLKFLSTK